MFYFVRLVPNLVGRRDVASFGPSLAFAVARVTASGRARATTGCRAALVGEVEVVSGQHTWKEHDDRDVVDPDEDRSKYTERSDWKYRTESADGERRDRRERREEHTGGGTPKTVRQTVRQTPEMEETGSSPRVEVDEDVVGPCNSRDDDVVSEEDTMYIDLPRLVCKLSQSTASDSS